MNGKVLYHVISLNLGEERSESRPYEIRTDKDYLFILSLDGSASLSISGGDFFPLKEEMRILLPSEQKEIEIINPSQVEKSLQLFVGEKGKCEVKNG